MKSSPGSQPLRRQNWVLLAELLNWGGGSLEKHSFMLCRQQCRIGHLSGQGDTVLAPLAGGHPHLPHTDAQGPFFYHQGQLRSKIHPQRDGLLGAQGAASPSQGSPFPLQPLPAVSDAALSR